MRHRIKKIPTLSNKSHLLHSDKSTYTYFYKGKVKVGSLGKHILYSPSIPLLGGTVLLLVLGLSIGCVGSNKAAYAETVTEEQCNSETKLALSLNGVTGDSVNLSKAVDDDITSGSISKVSQDFNVIACMVRNYKLYVQAESSLLKNTSVPDALYGVGENVAESAFSENTWGYNVAPKGGTNTAYNTVPELAETIPEAYTGNTSTSNTGQDFTITFAAKFGNNKPAGHYTSNVLLSMVAEPKALTLSDITNMQDMTNGICKASNIGDTKQLIDIRTNSDGKTRTYWVAKLADENCWMTQNLDYDDPNGERRTGDINPDSWSSNGSIRQYWDPGDKYCANNTTERCNLTVSRNDGHDAQGNYYSWFSATNGAGGSVSTDNTNVSDSICPNGWRLPAAEGDSDKKPYNNPFTFANMLRQYGFDWTSQNRFGYYGHPSNSATKDETVYTITELPFYMVYGGIVNAGLLYDAGNMGYYWSSTARSATQAYYLTFDTSMITPSSINNGVNGFSVRCVAR